MADRSQRAVAYLTAAGLGDDTEAEPEYIDVCGCDAAGELTAMLERDDLTLTAADRNRIIGALADIDVVSRD